MKTLPDKSPKLFAVIIMLCCSFMLSGCLNLDDLYTTESTTNDEANVTYVTSTEETPPKNDAHIETKEEVTTKKEEITTTKEEITTTKEEITTKKEETTTTKEEITTKKEETTTKAERTVYITPTGKKYHYSKSCAGKNAVEINLSDAKKSYEPCKKCT